MQESKYKSVAEVALYHHERYDGKGYPKGLKGNQIPFFARIVSICDSFHAMTNKRLYKKFTSKQEAINELQKCAGTQFDLELVNIFIDMIK